MTWEPATALNPQLIQDFEEGIQSGVQKLNADLYGYKATTLTVTKHATQAPPAKKAKNDLQNEDGKDSRYVCSIMSDDTHAWRVATHLSLYNNRTTLCHFS